jgi:ParB family chromosome partitioning protein
MTRKALGRGLSALLREVETAATPIEQVLVDLIDPNPFQPRRAFPDAAIKELTSSIRTSGVVQPVLLRRADARYQLVAGERRWRAARQAGLEAVPAVVRDLGDREALELALTENLLREDLKPLEIARGFATLQEKFSLRHEEIADRLGVNRTTVTNTMRLLRLPSSVQEMLANGEISAGHARALLTLDSAAAQAQLARMIVKQALSVRQVETMVAVREVKSGQKKLDGPASKPGPNTRAAITELERTLGTRVRIVGSEVRGRIEISYFSGEDLNRIYQWIVRA